MSEHIARVIKVTQDMVTKHPEADLLSVVKIEGFQVVVKTEDWDFEKSLCVYIMPDTILDTSRPEFNWLGTGEKFRVKAKRLRGIWSIGLLIPAPEFAKEGDNLYEYLGCEWYEPELSYVLGGDFEEAPQCFRDLSKFDVENLRNNKIRRLFEDNEIVNVTYKLNGSNCSFVYTEGRIWARSRSGFRKQTDNEFWKVLNHCPEIEVFCKDNPDTLIYGELVGQVKNFKYDTNGKIDFRCFDILQQNRQYKCVNAWLEACQKYNIKTVPIYGNIPFDFDKIVEIAEGPCPLKNNINEGVVVRPLIPRCSHNFGRVIGKLVSSKYLEKS
jgi:RNA ligase (TIGR02306 family)